MKKISLSQIELSGIEPLSREQLKNVLGGDGPTTPDPGDPITTTTTAGEDEGGSSGTCRIPTDGPHSQYYVGSQAYVDGTCGPAPWSPSQSICLNSTYNIYIYGCNW